MTLSPKTARGFAVGMSALLVISILLVMAFATLAAASIAATEAEKARNLIADTHKTCVKYADSEIVTGARKVHKAEIFRCPDGRLVELQD